MAGPQVRMPRRSSRGRAHPAGQLLLEDKYHGGGETGPFSEGASQRRLPFGPSAAEGMLTVQGACSLAPSVKGISVKASLGLGFGFFLLQY